MEYWIDGDNNYTFCDGDQGIDVPNHEMVVVNTALQKLIDIFDSIEDPLLEQISNIATKLGEDEILDTCMLRTEINDAIDDWCNAKIVTADEANDIHEAVLNRVRKQHSTEQLLSMKYDELCAMVLGHYDGDPRQFAVDNWNWIRVIHNNFDVRSITPTTVSRMEEFVESDEGTDISSRVIRNNHHYNQDPHEWSIETLRPHAFITTTNFDYRYLKSIVQEKYRRRQLQ